MSRLSAGLRQLRQYPTAVIGLIVIGLLLVVSIITPIYMPYSEAVRLWRGGETVWREYPRNAAPAWRNWFTSTEVQLEWDQETGFMPIRDSVATDEGYRAWIEETEPRLLPFVDMQQYAHNRPPVEQYAEISDAFSAVIERALYGQLSPEDALAEAEAAVNALLQ